MGGVSFDYFDQRHHSFKKYFVKAIIVNTLVELVKDDSIVPQRNKFFLFSMKLEVVSRGVSIQLGKISDIVVVSEISLGYRLDLPIALADWFKSKSIHFSFFD